MFHATLSLGNGSVLPTTWTSEQFLALLELWEILGSHNDDAGKFPSSVMTPCTTVHLSCPWIWMQRTPLKKWHLCAYMYNRYRVSFPGVKRPGLPVDLVVPRLKKQWSCTSTPLWAFMNCYRVNFIYFPCTCEHGVTFLKTYL